MTLRLALSTFSACLALSCGSSQTSLQTHMKALGDRLTTAKTDLDDHKAAIAAATDLAGMTALEGPHATKMIGHHDEMSTLVKDVKTCTKSGAAPDTAKLAEALAGMKSESDAHKSAMSGALSVAAARTEEERHQAAMAAKLTAMGDEQTAIAGLSGYSCAMEPM